MTETSSGSRVSISSLVVIPGIITLGVTILRLVGELQHWPSLLFSSSAGGGGAIVGIAWLAPIFGIIFALKLAGAGERPSSMGKAIGMVLAGLVVMVGGGALLGLSGFRNAAMAYGGFAVLAAAALIPLAGWPSLTKALLVYGYLARIPVAIVIFVAMQGNWGTHYDAPPPNFPDMGFGQKYFMLGVLPQLVLWITFTVISGSLFGTVAAAISGRGKVAAPATS